MPNISFSSIGDTPFQQLLGHNPSIMKAWNNLGTKLEGEESLTSNLKEQVRRTLAQQNGCEYCKAKGKPEHELFDEKTAIAVGFAEVFLKQKGQIENSIFKVLKETFNEREISELCAFICFTTASQYFGSILSLEAENKVR
ncbi:carboxymuconolactone decarboxylase family protein [Priestia megaterium]|uniref:carboxymuconolactone decarboxylase family protein n=1 Tax=Priestia megaterium TaxID=1404 RepID=UPI002E22EB70|nr:carboxymuconolactone decarboxylase family protein [Priestia megaterium]